MAKAGNRLMDESSQGESTLIAVLNLLFVQRSIGALCWTYPCSPTRPCRACLFPHKENIMNPADTCPSDLLDLMTAARLEHDRAIGDFIHRIWQALTEALTPSPASGPAHRPIQARPLPPGP